MTSTTTTGGARQSAAQAELSRRSQTPAQRIQHLLHGNPWLSPLVLLVVTIIVFSIVNPRFMQANSISLLVQQTAVVAALALGQTLVILTAGIDLSVRRHLRPVDDDHGVARRQERGQPGPLALIIGIAFGLLAGYLNGIAGDPAQPATVHRHPGHAEHLHRHRAALLRGSRASRTAVFRTSSTGPVTASRSPASGSRTGFSSSSSCTSVVGFALSQTAWGRHLYAVG